MANTTDQLTAMMNKYYAKTYTHNYIFGIAKGNDFFAIAFRDLSFADLLTLAKLDKPSHKHASRGTVARYKGCVTQTYKLGLEKGTITWVGTKASYTADAKEWQAKHPGCNMGDYFEYVISKMLGDSEWNGHNSDHGNVAGDLTIDGVPFQLKTNGGQWITETQYRNW